MTECALCGCTQAGKHERIAALTTELGAALTEHEAMRVENEAMTERFVPLVEENERLTRERDFALDWLRQAGEGK